MHPLCRNFIRVLFSALLITTSIAFASDEENRNAMRLELEQLIDDGELVHSNVNIASVNMLVEIYQEREFLPAWNDTKQVGELLQAINATALDGLDPADYHVDQVESIFAVKRSRKLLSPQEIAIQDLVLTDSLVQLGYHQLFGKVNPYTLDPNWNFRRELNDIEPAKAIQQAIDSPSLVKHLQEFFPRGWFYQKLQVALADYRQIAANGGWPLLAEGPTLKPGASDSRLPLLAQRLRISGDLAPGDAKDVPQTFDERLQQAVRHFQDRHGLDVDGAVGPATLRALNVPVEKRIEQLETNIERARWVLDDIEDDFVLVNIAAFRAYLFRDREVIWRTNVQVGKTYHQTPVFRDEIKYVDLNPTWTVPFSIASKEILPKIKNDPEYFSNRDFDLKDKNGKLVDPSKVDWNTITERNFSYWLVQRPGPNNALGRVKIMFPNKHAVYLHDTPSKALFGKSARAFSHGCIRVENPFDLAEQLLGRDGWNQEKFQQVLDSKETKRILLSKPMPVLLLYWTAMVNPQGTVYFYDDVYSRDAQIVEALNEPFKIDLP